MRVLTTSERVTVAIPRGPLACSVTLTGASTLAVTTIAERPVTSALARVVMHVWVGPTPIVGGGVVGLLPDPRSARTIASAAAATSADRTSVNWGGRLRTASMIAWPADRACSMSQRATDLL